MKGSCDVNFYKIPIIPSSPIFAEQIFRKFIFRDIVSPLNDSTSDNQTLKFTFALRILMNL